VRMIRQAISPRLAISTFRKFSLTSPDCILIKNISIAKNSTIIYFNPSQNNMIAFRIQ
jgi:hypothetical protein